MLGSVSRHKHPITPAMLVSFRQYLDLSSPYQADIWALFTVAFFLFLRKSILVAHSASSFNPDQQLMWQDIKFTDSGIVLHIRWSKTRQHKEGLHVIPLPSILHSPLCPVWAIQHYFALFPAPPSPLSFVFHPATVPPQPRSTLISLLLLLNIWFQAWDCIHQITPPTVSAGVGPLMFTKQAFWNI